jgi:hypothetical protein
VDQEKIWRYKEMSEDFKKKLTSRKFWICVAAFLGSVATSISGIVTDNQYVIAIGVTAGVLSAAIYAFCEAWVDSKAVDK